MKNISALAGISVAAFAVFSGQASAGGGTDTNNAALNLQLTIEDGCNVNFDSGSSVIDFGIFIALKNPIIRTGSFSLKCTAGYDAGKKIPVSLSAGSVNPSDKAGDRKLYLNGSAAGGKFMHFQVFQGSGTADIWGDGSENAQTYNISYSKNNPDAHYPFTLRLDAQDLSGLSAGAYSNVLTAAVKWP